MPNKVSLSLGERSYDIVIEKNALDFLPQFLAEKKYSKIFVITDENVANLHLSRLCGVLHNAEKIILPCGEKTKSFALLEKTCEEILSKGIDRRSLIVAFGGGVVGDFAGFAASILLRGIDFIQIPTTLLAMVDSSVGGKTAINSHVGKNLVGSFYQPKLVLCDIEFLKTLPLRELRSGYAEVVKYGFIRDEKFFEFLEKNHQKIFSFDEEILQTIITNSCRFKAEIVGRDERESSERALLNFGHTFGHIFETECGYSDEILHGEAVALGMVMAAKMSQNFGMILRDDFVRIVSHLENCGFITDPKNLRKNWNKENLTCHLFKDKKVEDQKLTFILLERIGKAVVRKGVELKEFKKVLREFVDIPRDQRC
ncbi:MAG: 3-dehydroquinate synthase [Alphaproteobacteria bacterium RIFCSPLOWO2_01_FULL_40_26]|nr:MAG: 3-dehydroquinate synthase [Alphaproteobacteria bacterium RIFCSPHIGHO2_02_FULL_40_34]OFW86768.1 MAG: 3-dehydroquinate synthase [Alphaproteobacteria bacterium RIFCSPHIGHO2_01_FULL_40_8]OFW94716.1 MAG: 3-dehydroquinate synthase [Alphaproteobacteria bacterium RIFCSPLOWO2_01_FULL_40_26]OFX10348.1 MAG: 3-dehydroquinate synthase [Alphaproteobacteria bacterium RIFCSPLOWO2_02_FULL_40_19]OFX11944.1 MAG: 3-dehydroquinate synthase [Alphaproteobacteria bacterium RIFCSPLOWO2_12_FULL_40_11]